tara:strand:- start:344 stop:724 length:381 start_codon:yes stop_codon:yes gene_type:complete
MARTETQTKNKKNGLRNSMTEDLIRQVSYTKAEVDSMIAAAVAEAHEADRIIMAKHNRDATVISMILGFICLALFVDGLLRILGIVPPFMDLDVNVIDDVIDKVESDLMPMIQDATQKAQKYIPRR